MSLDDRPPPRVWAILCYRAGENSQIRALADGLGWPYEEKRLHYRSWGYLADVWRGIKLTGIDRRRSSPLGPPWPDLIISAAMRNEPVCRWIRRQSGGLARYVHLGKPWADASRFDLVITVPEYPVPDRPNVLRNSFSLHAVTDQRLADEARIWAPRLAHLPRPYVAVLMGGYSGRYALDPEKAERLAREASALARGRGGSLLITTSSRTAPSAVDALERAIDVPYHLFRWRPEAACNPYFGYLALAHEIVVTCESATMLAEACATGRPVYIFDLDRDAERAAVSGEAWRARLRRLASRCNLQRLKARLYRDVFLARRATRDHPRHHPRPRPADRLRPRGLARPGVSAGRAAGGGRPGTLGCEGAGPGRERRARRPLEHHAGRRHPASASARDRPVLAEARMRGARPRGGPSPFVSLTS